jgi:protein SCO1/2
MPVKSVIAAAILAAAAIACSRSQTYELRGQIVAVDPSRQEITVKHEDIRGFMPGMTMPFKVRDRTPVDDRTPGELITATLVVRGNEVYLVNVRRIGHADLPPGTAGAPRRFDLLEPGAEVPDEPFVDQNGASRRLSVWRKKVLAVTFIYTRCPLPDFCPRMDRQFLAVQKAAAQDPILRERFHLLSVSFDPDHDTPPVLAAQAGRVGADTTSWSFVTGHAADIERFASRFGVSIVKEGATAQEIVHNLRTAVIDADGRLVKVFGKDWTPGDLVSELRNAVGRR